MPGSAQPLRLVLDMNVVVAGLLWSGPPVMPMTIM